MIPEAAPCFTETGILRQRKGSSATTLPLYQTSGPATRNSFISSSRRRRRTWKSSVTPPCVVLSVVLAGTLVGSAIWTSHPSAGGPDTRRQYPRKQRHRDQMGSQNKQMEHPHSHHGSERNHLHHRMKAMNEANDALDQATTERPKSAIKRSVNTTTTSSPIQEIVCSDGTSGIVNDDYCDCQDGIDEPNTSACSHLTVQQATFACADGISFIYSSRVGDGIRDCLDGSDEKSTKDL